jgi:steroid 5-alpha reductase family enzyme
MTNTLLEFLVPLWVTLAIAFSLLWFALRNQSKYEMVDAFWAWSLGVCAIVICIFSEGHELRRWLMTSLTFLWAIRLGGFLFWGRIKKGITDGRYENWIKEMGNKVDIKMFILLQ